MNDNDVFDVYGMRVTETRMRRKVLYDLPLRYRIDMTAQEAIAIEKWENEKIFSIEITETDLCRMHDDLIRYNRARHPYERDEIEYRESYLRRNNSAVKKAWDNYRMMVKLAADGKVYD